MHHCLEVQEIVAQICYEAWSDDSPAGRRAVLSLAQTARSFNDTATDIIWRRIPNIRPLLNCSSKFSGGLEREYQEQDPINAIQPNELQFGRIKQLAMRVHHLGPIVSYCEEEEHIKTLDILIHQEIDTTSYRILHDLYANEPHALLPNLRSVNLGHLTINFLPFVFLLTNPDIKGLGLVCSLDGLSPESETTREFLRFFRDIGSKYPALETLDLHVLGTDDQPEIPNYLADMVSSNKFSHLTHFCIGQAVFTKIIPNLFQYVPKLQSLDIRVPLEHNSLPPSAIGWSDIKSIKLHTPQLNLGTELLERIQDATSMKTLCVINEISPSTSSICIWSSLIKTIHAKCIPERMEDLYLKDFPKRFPSGVSMTDGLPPFSLQVDILEPLCVFHCLTSLTVLTIGVMDLDDPALKKLAASWPQIQNLELLGWSQISPPPKVTLDGLAALADYCPNLKELGIEFHAHSKHTSLPHGKPRHQLHLKELLVCDSVITSFPLVAALLADIFPTIDNLEWSDEPLPGNEDAPELWNHVWECYHAFSNVRADEIRRFQTSTVTY